MPYVLCGEPQDPTQPKTSCSVPFELVLYHVERPVEFPRRPSWAGKSVRRAVQPIWLGLLGLPMLKDSERVNATDKAFDADVVSADFKNHLFVRLIAKDKRFTKVDFKYTIFDSCYLRGCTFTECDFTGCRFKDTSFHGATFFGCKFEYTTFERT